MEELLSTAYEKGMIDFFGSCDIDMTNVAGLILTNFSFHYESSNNYIPASYAYYSKLFSLPTSDVFTNDLINSITSY